MGDAVQTIMFFALLAGIFYFLLVRPTQKRTAAHRDLVESISVGDEIVTIGGLFGEVVAIGDDYMELETAPGVRLRYTKTAIHHRVNEKLAATARKTTTLPATAADEPARPEANQETAAKVTAKKTAAKKTTRSGSARKSTATAKKTTAKTTGAKSTAKKTTAKKTTASKKTTRR